MSEIRPPSEDDSPPPGIERSGWERFRDGTGAVLRRLPFLRRPHFAIFPVMAVLIVIAVAFGMQLGESAVAQIDPVYRKGPAPKIRDVSNDPRPARTEPTYAASYGWEQGQQARAQDCGDCPSAYDRSAYAPPPSVAYTDPTIEPAWERVNDNLEDRATRAGAEDSVEWQRVRRYVYYPVSGEPDVDIPPPPRRAQTEQRAAADTEGM